MQIWQLWLGEDCTFAELEWDSEEWQWSPLQGVVHSFPTMLKLAHNIRLVTCTEGNWGRAVSRMAKYLGIPATIYVPGFMNEYTRSLIRSEGADVRVLPHGSYDDTIIAVKEDAKHTGALMVMDTSWEGYEEIPSVSAFTMFFWYYNIF